MAKGPGGKDEIRKDSIIRVRSPQADLKAAFSAEPVHGNVPLEVSFHDESTGTITGWNWSFGDGQVSNEQNPQHLYSQAGNYTVTLSIIGPNGRYQNLEKMILLL
jgi:PKD repeat protein